MIRHIVLMRFKAEITSERKAEIFAALGDLCGQLGGIVGFQAGHNVSPETHIIHGYHEGFWFDFTDAAARDSYLDAPAHRAVGRQIVAATEGGPEGLVVFDIELPD